MALPDFISKIKSRIEYEWRKGLYKNLVFKGGGVRGIAYMGALEALDEMDLVDGIQCVAGTSAGAIAATLTSFRLSPLETKGLFNSLDLSKVPQRMSARRKVRFWESKNSECYNRLFDNYGWFSSEYLYAWLQSVIAEECKGNGRATFAEFQRHGFRDLYITASNVSRQRGEVFSAETTPHVAVADAVRMSVSIPMVFEALQFDGRRFGEGDYYVDGGLFDNFPMHIFDHERFSSDSWAYRDGVNWESLGLFLYPAQLKGEVEPEEPKDVWEFLTLALRSVYNSHQTSSFESSPVDKFRTIEISDCGIAAVEFDITPGSEKHGTLHASGQQAVQTFFNQDKPRPLLVA